MSKVYRSKAQQSVPNNVWEVISRHAGKPIQYCKAILQDNYRSFRGVVFLEADFPEYVRDLASVNEIHASTTQSSLSSSSSEVAILRKPSVGWSCQDKIALQRMVEENDGRVTDDLKSRLARALPHKNAVQIATALWWHVRKQQGAAPG